MLRADHQFSGMLQVIVNAVSANFCFVGRDIIILAETRILRLSRT